VRATDTIAAASLQALVPADWAGRIATCWRASFDSVIETVRLIIAAEAALGRASK
jgi:hypothetical protein